MIPATVVHNYSNLDIQATTSKSSIQTAKGTPGEAEGGWWTTFRVDDSSFITYSLPLSTINPNSDINPRDCNVT